MLKLRGACHAQSVRPSRSRPFGFGALARPVACETQRISPRCARIPDTDVGAHTAEFTARAPSRNAGCDPTRQTRLRRSGCTALYDMTHEG
eukprot:6032515-Prymnesium_polylepis.1